MSSWIYRASTEPARLILGLEKHLMVTLFSLLLPNIDKIMFYLMVEREKDDVPVLGRNIKIVKPPGWMFTTLSSGVPCAEELGETHAAD
jgi:hypothetical protein